MIQKFCVCRDDENYLAFPDVALCPSGRLVCLISECTHHRDRGYTCVMLTTSEDRGRTWTPKRPLTEPIHKQRPEQSNWNCPRISLLSDGRLMAVVDRVGGRDEGNMGGEQSNWLFVSEDEGESWSGPHQTPVYGIVPDQVIELQQGPNTGRLLLAAHTVLSAQEQRVWHEQCWYSDDGGDTWHGPRLIAAVPELRLCEGSICEMPGGELVCFMRENSGRGLDAFKSISLDGGLTWEGAFEFPLPACHRPVAGMLQSGRVMITHRFMQGGRGWIGWWTQNFFAGLTDVESCLARSRQEAHTRIMPLDFDRSPHSDTGYSGWVQFDDGEIYVVNYILDDAPKAQIRGYAFEEGDFVLESPEGE